MSDIDALKEKSAQLEGLVEHWFFEAFHGSLVARSTDVWNAVHDAKEELKRCLAGFIAQSAETPKD